MPSRDRTKVNANEDEQKRNRKEEHPSRDGRDADTLEGPGSRHEQKGEADERNKTTRKGES